MSPYKKKKLNGTYEKDLMALEYRSRKEINLRDFLQKLSYLVGITTLV
jgi:hypothetical protein